MFALFKNKTTLLLLVIILLGGFFRFIGVNPGFNQYHSDEGISYSAATSMIKADNIDPLRYDYPALVPEVNYIAFRLFFIPVSWTKYYINHIPKIADGYEKLILSKEDYRRVMQHDIFGDREIHALFWGRYTTAFISMLSILLLYLLGKRLFGKNVGLLAAFLLAINFRSVTNSHIGLPDTYNAFFLICSLLLSFRLKDHRSKLDYLFAGIGVGFSLATKYQTFVVFPFLVMHFLSQEKSLNLRRLFQRVVDRKLYISGLTAGFVFLLLNPYLVIHFEQAYTWVSSVSLKYAMGRDILNLFPLHYWLYVDYGFLLFITIILGVLLTIKQQRIIALFLLSEVIPFLFVMMYYSVGGFYVRNFITITPLFLLFSAYFLVQLGIFLRRTRFFVPIFIVILLCISITSFQNVIVHVRNYTKAWNYQSIISVARTVIPKRSTVVGHPFDPLPENMNIIRIPISAAELYSLSEIQDAGADFAYINLDWAADPFYGWMNTPFPQNVPFVLQKPYAQMRETFWGQTIEEMMHFVVGSKYKPWQSPEANLFIVKVPRFDSMKFTVIKESDFSDKYMWSKNEQQDTPVGYLSYSNTKGSLQVGPGSGIFNISHFQSESLAIKQSYVYRFTAKVSSDVEVPKAQRSLFFSLHYYDENNNLIYSSVSPRFYGIKKDVTFSSQAPQNAHMLNISVGAANALNNPVYVEHIRLEESDKPITPQNVKVIPYSEYQDLLYPNSHGNL